MKKYVKRDVTKEYMNGYFKYVAGRDLTPTELKRIGRFVDGFDEDCEDCYEYDEVSVLAEMILEDFI